MLPILIVPLRDVFFQVEDGGGVQFDFQWNDVVISLALAMSTIPVFELGKAIRRALSKRKA